MELTLFQEGGLVALAREHRPGACERADGAGGALRKTGAAAPGTCDQKNKGPACN
jgi:hypothetical protein